MSNKEEKKLVPKLRFPEFANEPGWTDEPLAQRLFEHRLKSDGQSQVHSVSVHKGVVNQIEHLGRSFAAADTSKYNLAKPFDIIYTKSPTGDFPYGIVKQNLHHFNVILSPLYGVFSPLNKHLGYLLHSYFESPVRTNNYLQSLVQKGAKNTLQISNERFLSKGIFLPNNEREQQKIADCLSSLDELAAAESQKLEALKAHKKGLMQQLFPAEGETVPRLRFKGFKGEWEEKKLDEITRRGSGHTPSKSRPENYNGGIKWVSLADLKRLDHGLITETATEISIEGIQNSSAVLHPTGSVLISRDAGVGKSAVMGNSMAVSQHFIVWICNDKSLNNWFLYYLLQKSKPLFERAAIGSTIKTIGLQFFKDLIYFIPSLPEQQKIADCLSSVDALITAQTEKIEALKRHKKGLMQALFPAIT